MFSSLETMRCYTCNGLTKHVNSDGLGQGYKCLQDCTKHCEYIFHYIPNKNNKVAIEKFIFPTGKLIVKHFAFQSEYYQLQEILPGFQKHKLITSKTGAVSVTPETALNFLNKVIKTAILE